MTDDIRPDVMDTVDDLQAASRTVEYWEWDDLDFCNWIAADLQIGVEHCAEVRALAARRLRVRWITEDTDRWDYKTLMDVLNNMAMWIQAAE